MRLKAFIFDDDDIILSLLHHIMEERGYEVHAYAEPRACPEVRRTGSPCAAKKACCDIIISDLNMPGMNGLELIENQLKDGCKVPNLALMSGAWATRDRLRAQNLGCKIFNKPFRLQEINDWLEECEARSRSCHRQALIEQ